MAHTTITTGYAPILLRAVDPIHHGAGTSGNTALVRMQDAVTPDGQRIRTPFISGNSLRHTLRDALAWEIINALEIEDGSLEKSVADLLFSGGALTATGAQINLDAMRERHALLPSLGLLGYSHKSDIVRGSLRVENAHLLCQENTWRTPKTTDAAANLRAGEWLGEEFGTRHDIIGGPATRLIDTTMFGDAPSSTQMIYDMQVIKPGSLWSFAVGVDGATPGEVDALAAALTIAGQNQTWWLGAKNNQGYGRCSIVTSDTSAITDNLPAAAARHRDHLIGHVDAIRELLVEGLK